MVEVVGDHGLMLKLTLDGKEVVERSVEHVCHYHHVGRFREQQENTAVLEAGLCLDDMRERARRRTEVESRQQLVCETYAPGTAWHETVSEAATERVREDVLQELARRMERRASQLH